MKTDLHMAVLEEQVELVSDLIAKGINLEEKDSRGNTPLHIAVESRNLAITKLLIDAGGSVNMVEGNGDTLLHSAVKSNNLEITKLLVSAGVKVNEINKEKKTALYYAIKPNSIDISKLLVSSGADVYTGIDTPLNIAISTRNLDILKLFVDAGIDLSAKDEKGNTPLHFAAARANSSVVRLLVNSGSDVNAVNKYNETPLHMVANTENLNIMKVLIDSGAAVNAKDYDGRTPLYLATRFERNINTIKFLLKSGADVNATDKQNSTPLQEAAAWDSDDVILIKLLLESGAHVHESDVWGRTPLHLAAECQNLKSLQLLLDVGANVNSLNKEHETPLLLASKEENVDIMKCLLKAGASTEAKDIRGNNSLHNAVTTIMSEEIFKILIEAGTPVNECNKNGDTVLEVLAESSIYADIDKKLVLKCLKVVIEYINVNLTKTNGENIIVDILKLDRFTPHRRVYYKIILKFIAKVKSLNFQVDPSILNAIFSKTEYINYFTECTRELEKAKNVKLHNCWVTFFNLLVDDEFKFVKYAGNKDLIEDFQKNIKKFSIYRETMENNVSKGIQGREWFDVAANNLSFFWPIFNPSHLIVRDILDVLSKDDWKNLCEKKFL